MNTQRIPKPLHPLSEDLVLKLVRNPNTPTAEIHKALHEVNRRRGNDLHERPWICEEFEELYEDRRGRTA
jgi:hypothetical protein